MSVQNSGLGISSEIGRLREAIVHTPGRELELVTPRNFGRMRMDDILYLKAAQQDHEQLVAILSHAGVHVHQLRDLLHETILCLSESERREFSNAVCDLEGCTTDYRRRIQQLPPEGLAEVCILGEQHQASLTSFLRQELYNLAPIPNLLFIRDIGAVVNRGVILSVMAHSVRARESLLFEWILRYHPLFHSAGMPSWLWLGGAEERRNRYLSVQGTTGIPHLFLEGANFRLRGVKSLKLGDQELLDAGAFLTSDDVRLEIADLKLSVGRNFVMEGGNVFVLSENALLIGCNERASPAAIDALAREMLELGSSIKTILVAVCGAEKGHFFKNDLDTGFAILYHDIYHDREILECLVHQPMIEAEGANITIAKLALEQGQLQVHALPDLRTALKQVDAFAGADIEFIPCGGEGIGSVESRIYQEREWHHQAVNVLVLAPGKLIAFRRNKKTIKLLEARGYEVIPARCENDQCGFMNWTKQQVSDWLEDRGRRSVIVIRDEEISRAHGGPRSLVLPLRRDPYLQQRRQHD